MLAMGRKQSSKNVTPLLKSKTVDLVRSSMTHREVSIFYNVPKNTIKTIIRRNKISKNGRGITKNGRKFKLGLSCVQRLLNYVRENNSLPLFAIAAIFRATDGDTVSERTIRRCLHNNGIRSYIAAAKTFLTAKHIASRLSWCADILHWKQVQWNSVAFTDEPSFTLRPLRNHMKTLEKSEHSLRT